MRMDKLTLRAQDAVNTAQNIATEKNHYEIQPEHLLKSLVDQDGGIFDAMAKKIGVSIHSIFIGREQCPPILKKVSKETGGIHFQVMPNKEGMVKIFELFN